MDTIKIFFLYIYEALHAFDFGFWPSLAMITAAFVGANGLYYLYTSKVNLTEDTVRHKRGLRRFWWLLLVQIIFLAQGLLAIYFNNTMVSGSIYRLFILYYLVSAFCILIFGVGLFEHFIKRQNKQQ